MKKALIGQDVFQCSGTTARWMAPASMAQTAATRT